MNFKIKTTTTAKIMRPKVRPQVKQAVNLVVINGHFNLPQESVWLYMS